MLILFATMEGSVPWPRSSAPAIEPPAPAVIEPGVLILPLESMVAVVAGVCSVCEPPPVTMAVDVKFPELTTVTVPVPLGAAHAPSPRKNVDEEQAPDQSPYTSAATAAEIAPVVVVFLTSPVARVAQFWLELPRVWVAVFAIPDPPFAAGRIPDTSAVKDTAANVGAPAALPWSRVVVVPSDDRTTTSEVPLPRTIRLAVRVADVVTLPDPDGVAHVPSPRQNVEDDADVPEFRFVTGRFPVTPVLKGSPVRFVATPLAGVPSTGVTSVAELARTTFPVPVEPTKL